MRFLPTPVGTLPMKISGWSCLLLPFLMIGTVLLFPNTQRIWEWALVALWMVLFVLCIGVAVTGQPLGILINEQNLMSLSRFQAVLWTVIIVSALLVIAAARLHDGVAAPGSPLDIKFTPQVLSLLGITSAALVGSPLIDATKKSKTPAPSVAPQTAAALETTNNVPDSVEKTAATAGAAAANDGPAQVAAAKTTTLTNAISQNAQGLLFKNPKISDASFSDMFEGTEVGDAAHVDLAKVQMFCFTLIVALTYIYALGALMIGNALDGVDVSFPPLSDGMVALLGISNGGYLGGKAVDHTKT
jgi:hypothetical protein